MNDRKCMPEDVCPPAFWSALTDSDILALNAMARSRNFDISLIHAIAKRCSYGYPQVIVCRPLTSEGYPFPTLFWLTCPYLDRKCGELESMRKISALEEIFKSKSEDVIDWHRRYSALRVSLMDKDTAEKLKMEAPAIWNAINAGGVGGIRWENFSCAAKCLHLQAATWLGMGEHPASFWLAEELGRTECDVIGGICVKTENELSTL